MNGTKFLEHVKALVEGIRRILDRKHWVFGERVLSARLY